MYPLNMCSFNITKMNQCAFQIQFEKCVEQKKNDALFKSDLKRALFKSILKNKVSKRIYIPVFYTVFLWKSESDSEKQKIEPERNSTSVHEIWTRARTQMCSDSLTYTNPKSNLNQSPNIEKLLFRGFPMKT